MSKYYEEKYASEDLFWGRHPSTLARIFFERHLPEAHEKMLDAGCGEGRDTVFFAQAGYNVTAFDASAAGVQKTRARLASLGLQANVLQADVNEFRLAETYDFILANGIFHYVRPALREETISNYKNFTRPGGLHAVLVPVHKPFIVTDPQADAEEHSWRSGEILTHYHDWRIEFFEERIAPDVTPEYQFAMNILIAGRPTA
jgi:tellurite methyltransferase